MDKVQWIKDLVLAEQDMEERGLVDFEAGFSPDKELENETIEFLKDLKTTFIESSSAFNQLKASSVGNIKIYGISRTLADFMVFRNGFKLIFSMKRPGLIDIHFNHIGSNFIPGKANEEDVPPPTEGQSLKAHWGAFGDLNWTYQGQPIKLDYLVRYYLSRFVRESAK